MDKVYLYNFCFLHFLLFYDHYRRKKKHSDLWQRPHKRYLVGFSDAKLQLFGTKKYIGRAYDQNSKSEKNHLINNRFFFMIKIQNHK